MSRTPIADLRSRWPKSTQSGEARLRELALSECGCTGFHAVTESPSEPASRLGYARERMLQCYDVAAGGYMGLGLLFMLFAPALAARVRGSGPQSTARD